MSPRYLRYNSNVGSYRLPTHRRGVYRKFFQDPSYFTIESVSYTYLIGPASQKMIIIVT